MRPTWKDFSSALGFNQQYGGEDFEAQALIIKALQKNTRIQESKIAVLDFTDMGNPCRILLLPNPNDKSRDELIAEWFADKIFLLNETFYNDVDITISEEKSAAELIEDVYNAIYMAPVTETSGENLISEKPKRKYTKKVDKAIDIESGSEEVVKDSEAIMGDHGGLIDGLG